MTYLDGLVGGELPVPAVAVRAECRPAPCRHHLDLRPHHRTRVETMGRLDPVAPAARKARCRTRDVAYGAQQRPPARRDRSAR
jgi:hypothetical protein